MDIRDSILLCGLHFLAWCLMGIQEHARVGEWDVGCTSRSLWTFILHIFWVDTLVIVLSSMLKNGLLLSWFIPLWMVWSRWWQRKQIEHGEIIMFKSSYSNPSLIIKVLSPRKSKPCRFQPPGRADELKLPRPEEQELEMSDLLGKFMEPPGEAIVFCHAICYDEM